MSGLENYSVLVDLYLTIVRYLSRLVVQRQLVAIVLALLATGVVTTFLVDWGERRYVRWCWHNRRSLLTANAAHERRRTLRYSFVRTGAIVLQQLTFPLVAIVFLVAGLFLFNSIGWLSGLLSRSITLLFLFTLYRLCMAGLYIFSPRRTAERYHRRLFGPLMFVFLTLLILDQLLGLNRLGKVVLFSLFDSPITIGALFLATVGLYFWIDATYGFQDVAQRVIVRRSHLHAGSVAIVRRHHQRQSGRTYRHAFHQSGGRQRRAIQRSGQSRRRQGRCHTDARLHHHGQRSGREPAAVGRRQSIAVKRGRAKRFDGNGATGRFRFFRSEQRSAHFFVEG